MILVTGGAFQGKLKYAADSFGLSGEDFSDGASCGFDEIYEVRGLNHFHEFVRRMLEEGIETAGLAERLKNRNPDIIIISNELGSGVIPADAFDREWREVTGRLCCDIAGKADRVCRVVCGIGTVIKDG